jgi:quinol monooxygenase YgiN
MILVDAQCCISPERQDDFVREVRKIVPIVQKEAGCFRYDLFADMKSGHFHFIEEWESKKHLDDHIAQPHMQEYFSKTAPWHASPAKLKIYEIHSLQSITMER